MRTASLANLYRMLATQLGAGVPMLRSLETLAKQAGHTVRHPAIALAHEIRNGASFGQALATQPKTFSELHREILLAGEQSGRLPELLNRLADMLEVSLAQRRRLYVGLIYPVIVLHLCVLVLAIARGTIHFEQTTTRVSFQALTTLLYIVMGLGPLYGMLGLLALSRAAAQRYRFWRATCQRLTRLVPLIGKFRKHMALARWSRTLEALYTAGISLPKGIADAGRASGDIELERQLVSLSASLDAGASPIDAFQAVRSFPADVRAMLVTGMESGKLDEMLLHIAIKEEDLAANTAKIFSVLAPVLAMLLIGGILVYFILSFFLQGYIQPINELLRH